MKLENDFFWAEIDGRTGGLGSFVLKRDPDRMNWVEGREVWGGVRALTGMEEPEPVSFVSLEKQGHAVVSHYENEELRISVTRSLSPAGGLREEYAISGKNRVPLFFNRGDLGIYATFNDSYARRRHLCETALPRAYLVRRCSFLHPGSENGIF